GPQRRAHAEFDQLGHELVAREVGIAAGLAQVLGESAGHSVGRELQPEQLAGGVDHQYAARAVHAQRACAPGERAHVPALAELRPARGTARKRTRTGVGVDHRAFQRCRLGRDLRYAADDPALAFEVAVAGARPLVARIEAELVRAHAQVALHRGP